MEHQEGTFKGQKDLDLFYQSWMPGQNPKAILLVVHGLAEHSGRYHDFADYLVSRGYGVYSYDQRGHGKSEGLKGYVESYSNYVKDLDTFFTLVRNRYDHDKIFLVGHSMGGTIAASYAVLQPSRITGLVLSGALLRIPANIKRSTIFIARILSLIFPKAGLYFINAESISRDKKVVNAYQCDPQVYQGKIRARLGVELLMAMDTMKDQFSRIRVPILVMHGMADLLSAYQDSEFLYREAGSPDKTLKLYDGLYHEIFNEPQREQVLEDLISWLAVHE